MSDMVPQGARTVIGCVGFIVLILSIAGVISLVGMVINASL